MLNIPLGPPIYVWKCRWSAKLKWNRYQLQCFYHASPFWNEEHFEVGPRQSADFLKARFHSYTRRLISGSTHLAVTFTSRRLQLIVKTPFSRMLRM